jgi:hypothetical protein
MEPVMRSVLIIPALAALAACSSGDDDAARDAALIDRDPVIARALHDPLMSDPDLAARNQANAAIGFADSTALPVLPASSTDAQAAREALRLELLESGPIPDLPPAQEGKGKTLGPMSGAADLLAAVGAPATCATGLKEDFALAAGLPPASALPPRGMVQQAGGSDAPGCRLRIVRYLTAAPREDVLQYHHARALRAGLASQRQGDAITAGGKGAERLAAHVRAAPHGLTGVTLVYRAN